MPSSKSRVLSTEELQGVYDRLDSLIETYIKYRVQGKTYQQIGDEYGISREAVRQRISRLVGMVNRGKREKTGVKG